MRSFVSELQYTTSASPNEQDPISGAAVWTVLVFVASALTFATGLANPQLSVAFISNACKWPRV
jgi:hypothetical protein